jgi:hypothetical protein
MDGIRMISAKFTVDPAKAQAFSTTLNTLSGVSINLVENMLTVIVREPFGQAKLDLACATLRDIDPGATAVT